MKIILVDATTYRTKMDSELLIFKRNYFVVKNFVKNKIFGHHKNPGTKTFSLGLLRIATILKFNAYDIIYIHIDDFKKDIENILDTEKPDIVAFSSVCPTVPLCNDLRSIIKMNREKCLVLIGGAHINVAKKLTEIRYPGFDGYISGSELEACEMIVKNSIKKIEVPDCFVDYKLLPYDINDYLVNAVTTLGCKYKCAYCQEKETKYFENSLDADISNLMKILEPKSCIHIFDSNFGYSDERYENCCKALTNLNHDFLLSCDMRSELVTLEKIEKLRKAGFREIRIGLESGSNNVLEKTIENIKLMNLFLKLSLSVKYQICIFQYIVYLDYWEVQNLLIKKQKN